MTNSPPDPNQPRAVPQPPGTPPRPSPKPAPNALRSRDFRLHWWAVAPLALLFVLAGVLPVLIPAVWGDIENFNVVPIGYIGLFLFVVLPSWLAFRRKRSKLAGSVVCTILSVLLLVSWTVSLLMGISSANGVAAEKAVDEAVARGMAQHTALMERKAAGEDVDQAMLDSSHRLLDDMAAAAQKLTGSQRAALEAAAQVAKEIGDVAAAYRASSEPLTLVGGMASPAGLDSPAAIQTRLKQVENLAIANEALDQALVRVADRYRQILEARGVGGAEAQHLVACFLSSRQSLHLQRQMRQNDRDLIGASHDILLLLHGSWGHWSYNPDTDEILFDRDDDSQSYSFFVEKTNKAAAEHERVQRQVVDLARKHVEASVD